MNFRLPLMLLLLTSFSFSAMATQTGPWPFPPTGPLDECPSVNDPSCNDAQVNRDTSDSAQFNLDLDGFSDELIGDLSAVFGTQEHNLILVYEYKADLDGWWVCETTTEQCILLPNIHRKDGSSENIGEALEDILSTLDTLSNITVWVFYPDGSGGMWGCNTDTGTCIHYPQWD